MHGAAGEVFNLPESWLPQPFQLCDGRSLGRASFLWLDDPTVLRDEAFMSVDFHCGGMCGVGKRYHLQRVGSTWRVTGSEQPWVS